MAQAVLPRVQSTNEDDVFHLTGVRAALTVSQFPAIVDRLYVFVQMSGHRGKLVFTSKLNGLKPTTSSIKRKRKR